MTRNKAEIPAPPEMQIVPVKADRRRLTIDIENNTAFIWYDPRADKETAALLDARRELIKRGFISG